MHLPVSFRLVIFDSELDMNCISPENTINILLLYLSPALFAINSSCYTITLKMVADSSFVLFFFHPHFSSWWVILLYLKFSLLFCGLWLVQVLLYWFLCDNLSLCGLDSYSSDIFYHNNHPCDINIRTCAHIFCRSCGCPCIGHLCI